MIYFVNSILLSSERHNRTTIDHSSKIHLYIQPTAMAPSLLKTSIFYFSLLLTYIFTDTNGWSNYLSIRTLVIIFAAHLLEFVIFFGCFRYKLIGLNTSDSALSHFFPTMMFGFQHWMKYLKKRD